MAMSRKDMRTIAALNAENMTQQFAKQIIRESRQRQEAMMIGHIAGDPVTVREKMQAEARARVTGRLVDDQVSAAAGTLMSSAPIDPRKAAMKQAFGGAVRRDVGPRINPYRYKKGGY